MVHNDVQRARQVSGYSPPVPASSALTKETRAAVPAGVCNLTGTHVPNLLGQITQINLLTFLILSTRYLAWNMYGSNLNSSAVSQDQ
jgi:hypothetical protein